jgi:hypothetical protein
LSKVDHVWKIRDRKQRTDTGKYSFTFSLLKINFHIQSVYKKYTVFTSIHVLVVNHHLQGAAATAYLIQNLMKPVYICGVAEK